MRISDWSSDVCSSDLHRDRDRSQPSDRHVHDVPISGQQLVPDLQGRLESNGCATLDERDGCNVGGFATLICFGDDILLLLGLVDLRRSEEHTSELQSLMRISYAVFCLKKKNTTLQYSHRTRLHH